jgi:hypothetical protein
MGFIDLAHGSSANLFNNFVLAQSREHSSPSVGIRNTPEPGFSRKAKAYRQAPALEIKLFDVDYLQQRHIVAFTDGKARLFAIPEWYCRKIGNLYNFGGWRKCHF